MNTFYRSLVVDVQTHTVESCARCPVDFVEYGLWPISTKSHTFMTFETIQLLSTLTNFSPTTSVTSIVNTLNFNTQWNSKGVSAISLHNIKIYYVGTMSYYI